MANDVIYIANKIPIYEMNSKLVRPDYLKEGDIVGICAPARKVIPEEMSTVVKTFEGWGLEVQLGKNLYKQNHQFSGTDKERAADLQELLDNPNIKAIFCARGGYGCMRLLPLVNWDVLRKMPKWIVGYSDITAIHQQLRTLNVESIHAPMPIDFTQENRTGIDTLHEALFGKLEGYQLSAHKFNRQGRAEGILVGGNLSILYALQGTPYAVNGNNIILFIEDIDEYLYHIDRMIVNLKLSGLLQNIKGLIIGGMTGMRDNAIPFGKTAYEIIKEHTDSLNIPVCYNFSAGHIKPNNALYFGRELVLNVENDKVQLEYM